MNIKDIFNFTPVRARVAFVLGIAEYAMELYGFHETLTSVRHALDAAWDWERGGSIEPKELYEFVESFEGGGSGLLFEAGIAMSKESSEESILQVSAIAVGYVAREAYLQIQTRLPETIEQADDEAVQQAITIYMPQIRGYDPRRLDRIGDYLLANFRTTQPDMLGPVLNKDAICAIGRDLKR